MIGEKSEKKILAYLEEIGDVDAIERRRSSGGTGQGLLGFGKDYWDATGMLLGYIAPDAPGSNLPVVEATALEPDTRLRNKRVKISLDGFRVHCYPGLGKHKILCEFTAKNQIKDDPEEVKSVISTEAADRSNASVMGTPIFLGVCVGENGIAFEGRTVNVSSSGDAEMMSLLDTQTLKSGITLLTTAQPAIKPFVGLVTAVLKSLLNRSQNKEIHKFKLGLDFEKSRTSACLRLGSFLVIQGSPKNWS